MKYSIWITITVNHSFFHSESTGLELRETDATSLFLKKSDVLFRKQSLNQWVLLKPEMASGKVNRCDLLLKETGISLDFELVIKSPAFYYFTSWGEGRKEGKGWNLTDSPHRGKNRKVLQINLTPEAAEVSQKIDITFQSREVRWEFILIPKYSHSRYPVELKEDRDRLLFSTPELISFPGEKMAYRSVSSSFIAMKESYDYKINLWEKRENGKRLLSTHIPFPRVASASLTETGEMITSYFYF